MFDFNGTGPQQKTGNCNAPRAVTLSALIYCLRCMVGYDVPLNQVLYYLTVIKLFSIFTCTTIIQLR